jgi:hypothetical protein
MERLIKEYECVVESGARLFTNRASNSMNTIEFAHATLSRSYCLSLTGFSRDEPLPFELGPVLSWRSPACYREIRVTIV